MSIEFASPPMLAVAKKINRAQSEMGLLDEFLALKSFDTEVAPLRWAAIATVATALHNIYHGMEDVMKVVCRDVDRFVPGDGASHQDILDQVASPRKGIRPALVSEEWYPDVNELRAYRHVVNHSKANELWVGYGDCQPRSNEKPVSEIPGITSGPG